MSDAGDLERWCGGAPAGRRQAGLATLDEGKCSRFKLPRHPDPTACRAVAEAAGPAQRRPPHPERATCSDDNWPPGHQSARPARQPPRARRHSAVRSRAAGALGGGDPANGASTNQLQAQRARHSIPRRWAGLGSPWLARCRSRRRGSAASPSQSFASGAGCATLTPRSARHRPNHQRRPSLGPQWLDAGQGRRAAAVRVRMAVFETAMQSLPARVCRAASRARLVERGGRGAARNAGRHCTVLLPTFERVLCVDDCPGRRHGCNGARPRLLSAHPPQLELSCSCRLSRFRMRAQLAMTRKVHSTANRRSPPVFPRRMPRAAGRLHHESTGAVAGPIQASSRGLNTSRMSARGSPRCQNR